MPVSRPTVSVTDHAVIRYLERVHGFDAEAIRAEIVAEVERGVAVAASIGQTRTGVRTRRAGYVISEGCVITVVAPDMTIPWPEHRGGDDP